MAETVEIDFSPLLRTVADLERRLADAHRTMPLIAEALVSSVHEVFEREGAVGGKPRWPPLKRQRRRNRGGGQKILQSSGVMAGSITPASSDAWVMAYTGVRYAKYHVSKLPRKVIPLRDFFDIDRGEFYAEAADILLSKFR